MKALYFDYPGFTLLEVMIAMTIIAIALIPLINSQAQSVSMAGKARFNTTASFLAQSKIAEIEVSDYGFLTNDSGDFGDDFSGYKWELEVKNADVNFPENASGSLKQVDVTISLNDDDIFIYHVRRLLFIPRK